MSLKKSLGCPINKVKLNEVPSSSKMLGLGPASYAMLTPAIALLV